MLYFDEATHTYKIGESTLKSVSSIVSSQFRRFNAQAVAHGVRKNQANNPESPYYLKNTEEIVQMWSESGKEARDRGTALHRDIERFYLDGTLPEQPGPEWNHFLKFASDHPDWVNIGCEVRVHNHKVAGTIDAVFDTPEGIVIVDWKRCKAIEYSGYGQGVDVMKHVTDCNFSKYSLQLSLYRLLYPLPVKDAFIVQLHPERECYSMYRAQNFDIEAKTLIN